MRFTGLLPLLTSLAAFAQFDTAVILGTVRDANGGVIASASITAVNKQTGLSATAQTTGDGNYLFPTLRIGNYKITAEKQGFANALADDVNLTVNAR